MSTWTRCRSCGKKFDQPEMEDHQTKTGHHGTTRLGEQGEMRVWCNGCGLLTVDAALGAHQKERGRHNVLRTGPCIGAGGVRVWMTFSEIQMLR